jgi:hypothetical protein
MTEGYKTSTKGNSHCWVKLTVEYWQCVQEADLKGVHSLLSLLHGLGTNRQKLGSNCQLWPQFFLQVLPLSLRNEVSPQIVGNTRQHRGEWVEILLLFLELVPPLRIGWGLMSIHGVDPILRKLLSLLDYFFDFLRSIGDGLGLQVALFSF